MGHIIILIIFIVSAYLMGSINFAIIIFKLLGKEDPRNSHSGNAGTTNVYRQAGLFWASVILLLDLGRSIGLSFAALKYLKIEFVPWVAFSLIFGNKFPCFHEFRGGKGVANFLGFTVLVSPYAALLSAVNWVLVYLIVKIPFIASFFMIFVLSVGMILKCGINFVSISGSVAVFVFIFQNHNNNIMQLVNRR